LNFQTFEDNLYTIPLPGKGAGISGTQAIITYLKDHTGGKDELLSKIQSCLDEQQAKLTELKNRGMDKAQETISDIRAAHDELEPEPGQTQAKARQLLSSAKSLFS
jgi:Spy/CpxP family protein refolding chaperone